MYENVLSQIAAIDLEAAEGARVRARVRWAEEGESSSRYFFHLEKKRGSNSWVSAIRDGDGNIVSNIRDILSSWVSYYSSLFTACETDLSTQDRLLSNMADPLPFTAASECEGYLTVSEVKTALEGMAKGKSPGLDGLPAEFYLVFWDSIGADLVEVFNASFDAGTLPFSQRGALITLLYKKDDRLDPKNWRPISLLNVDYKLCARALAARLLSVIHHVVALDQTCGVPSRFIGENVALLRDVAELAQELDLPVALLSLDQEKAFDRVDWSFLSRTLSCMGFGPSFISWVKLLYTDIRSAIFVDGYISSSFRPSRGVRQGCPLSPLLYVLTMEVLAVNLRLNPDIVGLVVPRINVRLPVLSLYADDTTVITSSDSAIKATFDTYAEFERGTGSKLNLSKCEGLWLGAWRGRSDAPVAIRWSSDKVKFLGVYIGNGDQSEANWRPRIDAVEKCLNSWRHRSLSFGGRALVSNALALSRIWYVASLVPMPRWVSRELNSILFKFFWGGKRDLVMRDVVVHPREEGGFGVVSVVFKVQALLAQWVRRFQASPNSWVSLLTYWCFDRFGLGPVVVFSCPSLLSPSALPPFYASLLRAWRELQGSLVSGELVVGSGIARPLPLAGLTCKSCYKLLLNLYPCEPHCVSKFKPSFGDLDWASVWNSLFFMPLDRRVIDFNWKLAHGVLYTAERLISFGYSIPAACFCEHHVESSEHLFFSCPLARSGIDWIQSLLFIASPLAPVLTARHLLFGFSNDELRCVPRVFPYLLNVCKYCLWLQRNDYRFRSIRPSAVRLLASIKSRATLYLRLFGQRFVSDRRRRFFVRQWGANGSLGSFRGGVFRVSF